MLSNIIVTKEYQQAKKVFQDFSNTNNLELFEREDDFIFVTQNGCFFTIRYKGKDCFDGWDFNQDFVGEISPTNLCKNLQNEIENTTYINVFDKDYFYCNKIVCDKKDIKNVIRETQKEYQYFLIKSLDNTIFEMVNKKGENVNTEVPTYDFDLLCDLNVYKDVTKEREEYMKKADIPKSRIYYTKIGTTDCTISLVTNFYLNKIRIDIDLSNQKGLGKVYQKVIAVRPDFTKQDFIYEIQNFISNH